MAGHPVPIQLAFGMPEARLWQAICWSNALSEGSTRRRRGEFEWKGNL